MVEQVDCVVIGAGVVGLAVALALARSGREVMVLESERAIGMGTSSRNSEVIHAGIYYSRGSLKARLCVAGRELLYRYCAERGVEHRRLGKLIVATSEDEVASLWKYESQGAANGVHDLCRLTAQQIRELEPSVQGVAGLLSPSSGIVDSHGLMVAYQADIEASGGIVALNSEVVGGELRGEGITLEVGGTPAVTLHAKSAVNCAGLAAQSVSSSVKGLSPRQIPPRFLAKGHYFSLSGRSPFQRLVYPIANSAGLGTHVTLDLSGHARFGPDVKWIEEIDYGVDEARKAEFVRAIQLYYPALDGERLQASYTGIRPKLSGPGQPAADFCIRGPAEHAGPYVALYGIESPGLTASLAIAEQVVDLLGSASPATSGFAARESGR
jgi:L-2-hydroxyglutarate oxidase LhgO